MVKYIHVSHNIHNLLHLVADVRKFGILVVITLVASGLKITCRQLKYY